MITGLDKTCTSLSVFGVYLIWDACLLENTICAGGKETSWNVWNFSMTRSHVTGMCFRYQKVLLFTVKTECCTKHGINCCHISCW